jgi:hypothetical protein
MEGAWAPGYYYVLFEDPDGIRLELNFMLVPACSRKGLTSEQHDRISPDLIRAVMASEDPKLLRSSRLRLECDGDRLGALRERPR